MARVGKYDFLALGGGLHDGIPPSHILDNEFEVLENFYPFGTKIIRRGGLTRLSVLPHSESLHGFLPYRDSVVAGWTLFVGARTGFARYAAGSITALANLDAVAVADQTLPWSMFEYKKIGYAFRANESMRRLTVAGFMEAGLPAPATAVVLADGAAGAVTAANYVGVFTYRNSVTGAESDPSPESNILVHGAALRITWTSVDAVPAGSQADSRRLYRTLPGQLGEFYYVGDIMDTGTTTFDDNVVVADQGDSASFNNGMPPDGLVSGVIWNERAFAHDSIDVFFSEAFLPESWAGDSVISVFPDDGHRITTIFAFGDRLIIGKTNKVHYLLGTDPSSFELKTLSDSHGSFVQECMKSAEGLLFWFGGDNFYRSDGVGVEALATTKIRKLLERLTSYTNMSAEVNPERSLYIVNVPLDGATNPTHSLVYNYKTDAWSVFRYPDDIAPVYLASFFEDSGKQILYSLLQDGHVYQFLSGDDDYGTPIEARFRTKAHALTVQGWLKANRFVSLLCPNIPGETIVLSIYRNFGGDGVFEELPVRTRRVSLEKRTQWKRYSLSSRRRPGEFVQLEGTYNGAPLFELEGYTLHVKEMARQRRAS